MLLHDAYQHVPVVQAMLGFTRSPDQVSNASPSQLRHPLALAAASPLCRVLVESSALGYEHEHFSSRLRERHQPHTNAVTSITLNANDSGEESDDDDNWRRTIWNAANNSADDGDDEDSVDSPEYVDDLANYTTAGESDGAGSASQSAPVVRARDRVRTVNLLIHRHVQLPVPSLAWWLCRPVEGFGGMSSAVPVHQTAAEAHTYSATPPIVLVLRDYTEFDSGEVVCEDGDISQLPSSPPPLEEHVLSPVAVFGSEMARSMSQTVTWMFLNINACRLAGLGCWRALTTLQVHFSPDRDREGCGGGALSLQAIASLPWLTQLDVRFAILEGLEDWGPSEEALSQVQQRSSASSSRHRGLREVSFVGCWGMPRDMRWAAHHARTLRSLVVGSLKLEHLERTQVTTTSGADARSGNDTEAEEEPTLDVTALADCVSLRTLTIRCTPLLRRLEGLERCLSLREVCLEETSVSDLTPLAAPGQLRVARLRGCRELRDVAPLAACVRLKSLDLSDTRVGDGVAALLGALPELISLRCDACPRLNLALALRGTGDGEQEGVREPPAWRAAHVDPARLGERVRRTQLRELYARRTGLRSVDALGTGSAPRLRVLNLSYCRQLTDIGGVAALRRLRDLRLDNTAVDDLAPLQGLSRLRELSLGACVRVTDFAPLAGCSALETLDLCGTAIESLECLRGMASLAVLTLRRCLQIRDWGPLADCRALRFVSLSENTQLDDLSFVGRWDALQHLTLNGCSAVRDLQPLSRCCRLQSLYLTGCSALESIAALSACRRLEDLSLDATAATRTAPLAGPPPPQRATLAGTPGALTDLTPLATCPKLEIVSVDKDRLEALQAEVLSTNAFVKIVGI